MRPTGWFQVGWSTDLAVGEVKPLRYFGEDLVAFRGKDGDVHVLNAYCAHLGANLAYGGCVTDEGIQCPFHGWVWSPEGRNVRIPYQDRPNKSRGVRSWPVHESLGVISIWHDAAGRPPLFDLPSEFTELAPHLGERAYYPAGPDAQSRYENTYVHPQMLLENAVDPIHFRYVHGTPTTPLVLTESVDEWTWRAKVGFGRRWADGRDRQGDELNTLYLMWAGTGISYNVHTDAERSTMTVIACTPVDDDTTEVFGTYFVERIPGDEGTDRYAQRVVGLKAALPDDLKIWNNQRFLERPALATNEAAGFRHIREWGQNFYPDGELGPRDVLLEPTA
ncbi:MAG TPA: Rieske 2Fe-2S domain-containing protein [Mycobacteriales bacterium]|nr:Rieske 2Fe-2S domain-containing protein [Mycobacteriales bacterium]